MYANNFIRDVPNVACWATSTSNDAHKLLAGSNIAIWWIEGIVIQNPHKYAMVLLHPSLATSISKQWVCVSPSEGKNLFHWYKTKKHSAYFRVHGWPWKSGLIELRAAGLLRRISGMYSYQAGSAIALISPCIPFVLWLMPSLCPCL